MAPAFLSFDEETSIEDRIFKDNRKVYKRKNHMVVWSIISFIILVVGVILIFAMRNYALIGVSVASLGLVLFIIFSAFRSHYKKKLTI